MNEIIYHSFDIIPPPPIGLPPPDGPASLPPPGGPNGFPPTDGPVVSY